MGRTALIATSSTPCSISREKLQKGQGISAILKGKCENQITPDGQLFLDLEEHLQSADPAVDLLEFQPHSPLEIDKLGQLYSHTVAATNLLHHVL